MRVTCVLSWALVQVMAVPASRPQVTDQGVVPGNPDFSDNAWAHNWHELIIEGGGPCAVNRETNCFCSSNFDHDECDNTTTPAASGNSYGEYEDCYVVFRQPIDVFVPLFSIEARVTKWYQTKCQRYRWGGCCHKCPRSSPNCRVKTGCFSGCGCLLKIFKNYNCWNRYLDTYTCQRSFRGGDSVFVDGYGRNAAKDTHEFSGELDESGINGIKATHMLFRSDRDNAGGTYTGFKICAVNPWVNPGGHAPAGGFIPDGTVPPNDQACPCGTNPAGDNPQGTRVNPNTEASGDNCYSNPNWPCDRDISVERYHYSHVADYDPDMEVGFGPDNYIEGGRCWNWNNDNGGDVTNANNCRAGMQYSEAMQKELAMQKNTVSKSEHMSTAEDTEAVYNALVKAHNETDNPDWLLDLPESHDAADAPPTSGHVTKWELDVRASLQRNGVSRHIACCVCRGGWIAGYDPQGDMATETEIGEMTRPECILAVKKIAGANAASMDDTATDTVPGTCYAETNAHYSPAGWTSGSPRQACLLGE